MELIMLNPRFLALTGMILVAAASRLMPHPPNFAPIDAMALFGGAHFARKRDAFAVPLAAMVLSDIVLATTLYGWRALLAMPPVYLSFCLIVCIGITLRRRGTIRNVTCAALASGFLFYLITNFAVWMRGSRYPHTSEGLLACYIAALPYYKNTMASDLFYVTLLFGGFALAQRRWIALSEPIDWLGTAATLRQSDGGSRA
jgi:hypothetical protein